MSVGSLLVYTVTIVIAENPKDDYLQPPPPRSCPSAETWPAVSEPLSTWRHVLRLMPVSANSPSVLLSCWLQRFTWMDGSDTLRQASGTHRSYANRFYATAYTVFCERIRGEWRQYQNNLDFLLIISFININLINITIIVFLMLHPSKLYIAFYLSFYTSLSPLFPLCIEVN